MALDGIITTSKPGITGSGKPGDGFVFLGLGRQTSGHSRVLNPIPGDKNVMLSEMEAMLKR